MDRNALARLLVRPGAADREPCRKLSKTRFIPEAEWDKLKPHEKEFVHCYAVGAAAQKAILVARSAAVVNGLWTMPTPDRTIELTNPVNKPPRRAQWPEGIRYRAMQIPEIDYGYVHASGTDDQVWVTKPVRTAVDVARLHGVREGVVAMDSLFLGKTAAEGRVIRGELEATVDRLRGKKGIEHARRALELCSPLSESPFESYFRVVLAEHGIHADAQMWLGPDARADLIWGQVVIEIDGDQKYETETMKAVLDQLERESWMGEQEYEVVRIRTKHLLDDVHSCVQRVLNAHERAKRLGPPRVTPSRWRPATGPSWKRRAA